MVENIFSLLLMLALLFIRIKIDLNNFNRHGYTTRDHDNFPIITGHLDATTKNILDSAKKQKDPIDKN